MVKLKEHLTDSYDICYWSGNQNLASFIKHLKMLLPENIIKYIKNKLNLNAPVLYMSRAGAARLVGHRCRRTPCACGDTSRFDGSAESDTPEMRTGWISPSTSKASVPCVSYQFSAQSVFYSCEFLPMWSVSAERRKMKHMCSDSPTLTQRSSSGTFSLISHTSRFYSDASELVLHQSAYLITSNSQREMKDDKRRCSDSKPCNRRDPAGRTNLTPRSLISY